MDNTKIEIEDRTGPMTNVQLTEAIALQNQETKKALMALSNNDQIIIAQTKDALEQITEKTLYLNARVELLANLLEEVLLKKIETDEVSYVVRLSQNEYGQIVDTLRR